MRYHEPLNLRALQKWMAWAIMDPRGVDSALADENLFDYPMEPEPQPRALGEIRDQAPLSPEDRLSVYAEGYFFRLKEIADARYEGLSKVLSRVDGGRNLFHEVLVDYFHHHPPTSALIVETLFEMPRFLRSHWVAREFPYLPEIAALEKNIQLSYAAADSPTLSHEAISAVPAHAWGKARLKVSAAVKLMRTRWNALEIRQSRGAEEITKPIKHKRWQHVMVYRTGDEVFLENLAAEAAFLLWSFRKGNTLEHVCLDLQKVFPDTAATLPLMQWFQDWVEKEVISEITLAGSSRS